MGFDIVYKNRNGMSRHKSGGLLVAMRNTVPFKWKLIHDTYETLLSVHIKGNAIGMEK